jgi:hypothetical protein
VVNFLTATSERRPADVIGNAVKVTGHRRPARRHAAAADRWRSTSYTASFSFFAARKAIFLLALILIASPVAGFRPILAARFRTWGMPRPFRLIFVALLQMLRGERHQIAQNSLDLLLGEVITFGQFGSEALQRDGGQNRTFFWADFLVAGAAFLSGGIPNLLRPWGRPIVIVLIATEMSRAVSLLRHRAVRHQCARHSV